MADMPSIDAWLREAKADPSFRACGMYLIHNGTVRETPKAEARGIETDGVQPGDKVTGMVFSYDEAKVAAAVEEARALPGIGYVRVWLNSGELAVGDDIMLVLIGGDIRPRVIDGLQHLVSRPMASSPATRSPAWCSATTRPRWPPPWRRRALCRALATSSCG